MKIWQTMMLLFTVNIVLGAVIGYLRDGWNGVIAGMLWLCLCTWTGIGIGYVIAHYWLNRGR